MSRHEFSEDAKGRRSIAMESAEAPSSNSAEYAQQQAAVSCASQLLPFAPLALLTAWGGICPHIQTLTCARRYGDFRAQIYNRNSLAHIARKYTHRGTPACKNVHDIVRLCDSLFVLI